MAGTCSRFRSTAKKIWLSCSSSSTAINPQPLSSNKPAPMEATHPPSASAESLPEKPAAMEAIHPTSANAESLPKESQNPCAICLEPLETQSIFTAQCFHSFHFLCISSNVRFGNTICPICRSPWTHLPLPFNPSPAAVDPVLRILDDSIAAVRLTRRTSIRAARYDDDDPVPGTAAAAAPPRLLFNLVSLSSSLSISARLLHQQPTDIVLVANPNGPHLRLLKQAMALVIFSLRSVDRLAIVTYSAIAARALPLRRMTPQGKRAALQVIDRVFFLGESDPLEGLDKGVKILRDRTYNNPNSCILHLSDSPARPYLDMDLQANFPVHQFYVGFGFGASTGFVMHEFEEFFSRILGGVISEIQIRIAEEGRVVRLGGMRGGEERIIPLNSSLEFSGLISVAYSYVEGGSVENLISGEVFLPIRDKVFEAPAMDPSFEGRSSNVDRWDCLDPFMARRWAKHLHGYRG